MPPTPDAWQDYRRRRRRLLWVALGGIALLGLSFRPASEHHSGKPILAALVLAAGAVTWASVSLSSFPCPHCGKPFTFDKTTRESFTRECVHCQSPKWSNPA